MAKHKIGRNDPCWCGSRKKYKKCHADRSNQPPLPYHKLANDLIELRAGEKRCLYPSNPAPCSNPTIRAHSISRNAALGKISLEGKVYQGNANPFDIAKNRGQIKHALVGINLATTFTGFCSHHDNDLFRPIDEGNLIPTKEQIFLLHYRALCRELYVKRPTLMTNELLRDADRGKHEGLQQVLQEMITARSFAIEDSITKLESDKFICDQGLVKNSHSEVEGCALIFRQIPTLACSGLTQPTYDFLGNILQEISDMTKPLHNLSFTLLPNSSGGIAIIAWLKEADFICKAFVSSLLSVPDSRKSDALVQFVFDSFENHAIQPNWWDNLSSDVKSELEERMLNWTGIGLIDQGALVLGDTRFADWGFDRASWI